MTRAMRGIEVARNATAYVCDQEGNHKGQGLLLDLGSEGSVVLTCHHVIAPVSESDLHVRLPGPDGSLQDPVRVRYDDDRSRPQMDAVVLRLEGIRRTERPLLHKLGLGTYNGALSATVLTHLIPNNFNAVVRSSTHLDVEATVKGDWPDPPDRYTLQAFRLADPSDAREGISGGVVLCEEGVLGLVHFARTEGASHAREIYLVPLSVWTQGWTALEQLIEPLVDSNLRRAAKVKRARELGIGTDLILANYNGDLYVQRQADDLARSALEQQGSVVIVGKPKSGKTRLAWQLLRTQPEALVIVPDSYSSRPPAFEPSGLVGSEVVVFVDDLHRVAQSMDLIAWRERMEDASGKRCLLVCTTRDGQDWASVKASQDLLLDRVGSSATVFTSRTGEPGEEEGDDFSEEQGRRLASALKMSAREFTNRFDGTPGSLLLDLQAMGEHYTGLRDDTRYGVSVSRLLDSAKLLDRSGLPTFRKDLLRAVAEEIRGSGRISSEVWDSLVRTTQNAGFGQFDGVGNFQTYRPYLEQCVSYDPSEEEIGQLQEILYREHDAEGLYYRGIKLYDLGRLKETLDVHDRALELDPEFPEVWGNRGVVLFDLGRPEESLGAFARALALKPDDARAHFNRGNTLLGLEQPEKALEAYSQALTLRSDYYEAWANKGVVLGSLDRYEEAIGAYDAALTIRPDFAETLYNKGLALMNLEKYEEAVEALGAAIEIRPYFTLALYNKIIALAMQEKLEEAFEHLCRAWPIREQLSDSGAELARFFKILGKDPEECP